MSDPLSTRAQRLLEEWAQEVQEHGLWTNGHSIGAKLAEALAASDTALRALVEQWRENSLRSRANADNERINAADRRQCLGVSQAYEQSADDLEALLGASAPAGEKEIG